MSAIVRQVRLGIDREQNRRRARFGDHPSLQLGGGGQLVTVPVWAAGADMAVELLFFILHDQTRGVRSVAVRVVAIWACVNRSACVGSDAALLNTALRKFAL